MVYLIVDTPYEKCFDHFFKDELGYPNFYRMTELLTQNERYQDLVLIAAPIDKHPDSAKSLCEKVEKLGMKYLSFGEGLHTGFLFTPDGMAQIQPEFKTALTEAISQFMKNNHA